MRRIRLCAGMVMLLCLIGINVVLAQAHELVSIGGSAIVNDLIEEMVRVGGSVGADVIGINSTGTVRGFDAFCAGEIDLATATRQMTAAEREICKAYEITQSEILIGHYIVAFVAHPDVPAQCLQLDQLEDALRPTASNLVADWSFYRDENADLSLSMLLPQESDLAYFIVDNIIAGEGLRLDGRHYDEPSEAINSAASTPGALAVVPWAPQLADNEAVSLLEVGGDLGSCALPSAENVESGAYPFGMSLYLYVNRARLESSERLAALMKYSVSEASEAVISGAGATPPSRAVYDLNARLLADADADFAASGDADDFQVPAGLSGEIRIAGAANAHQALSRAGDGLGEQLNISNDFAGTMAGIGRLCAGEADIATLDSPARAQLLEDCASNDIVTVPLTLGAQATVLVGNAGDDFVSCLTTEEITTIWRADSAGAVESWMDIDESHPDLPLTLFGWSSLNSLTDILLQSAGDTIPPVRRDTEQDFDPLYRAAAVGNVSGGLTYMSWQDYQRVLVNEQANIQLVAVDAGPGCVDPNRGTIEDAMYPLARRASLLVNEEALADVNIQAFLWLLFDDDNWAALEQSGFIVAPVLELPLMRRELLRRFADAENRYSPAEGSAESDQADESAGDDESED